MSDIQDELNGVCEGFGFTDQLCKRKNNDDNDKDYYDFKNRPYPAPNPNFFAVLEKPGINRYVMRGCFKSNSTDKGREAGYTSNFVDIPLWDKDPTEEICDDYVGSFCEGRKETCRNDAPGGLADFTHPMPISGKEFLKNGFIVSQCECTMNANDLDDQPTELINTTPTKYTCWYDKHMRSVDLDMDFLGDWSPESCCKEDYNRACIQEGYKIGNKDSRSSETKGGPNTNECNDLWYPGSDWRSYENGELWSGKQRDQYQGVIDIWEPYRCYDWYNPAIDELPVGKEDKNNCSQYLLKWAKSCKWCKDNGSPTNDWLRKCDSPDGECGVPICSGECTSTLSGLLPDSCNNDKDTTNCKLCDSDLWDFIPGGWEGLVDENNPNHLMAKFAYIPKVVKTKSTCGQPTSGLILGDTPYFDDENMSKQNRATTFTRFGPFEDSDLENYDNNTPNKLYGSYDSCTEESWSNNLNIRKSTFRKDEDGVITYDENSIPEGLCDYEVWLNDENKINVQNKSIWAVPDIVGNSNSATTDLSNCEFDYGFTVDDNAKSHMMCERNPNLTGYGECDSENSYYAHLWLDGMWDMSKYVPESQYSEKGLTSEGLMSDGSDPTELKQRKIEAIRCCLGLTPEYSTDNNTYFSDNPTRDRFKGCRPGFVCPSSQGCGLLMERLFSGEWDKSEGGFDMYDFGKDYPENYNLNGSDELSKETMEDTVYYGKAYCQEMGGGRFKDNIDISVGCARSKDAEVSCRKMMYNYCVEPVSMELQDPDGVGGGVKTTNIKYPTRVFTDSCKDWCNLDSQKLDLELPNQAGVCDMAMGKTCQQLQVDGWIDPVNWENSKILKFVDKNGNWFENGDPTKTHSGLTAKRLKNVCGCFLLGAQCGSGNCSVTYCGAGTDGHKGPGTVSFFDFQDYPENNPVNKEITDMKSVYDFNGDQVAPKWKSFIDSNGFDCSKTINVDGNDILIPKCFEGCNYVNFNDTCWLASPEERRQNTIYYGDGTESFKNINDWDCKDISPDVGDSCKTYVEGNYGCFGYCNMGGYDDSGGLASIEGNCGTPDWFDYKMGITPNEVDYKVKKQIFEDNAQLNNLKANTSISWPKWQNFYTKWKDSSYEAPPGTVKVPGWGSFPVGSNGFSDPYDNDALGNQSMNIGICSYPGCSDINAVKPYSVQIDPNFSCPSKCSVSMQTNINNQGVVIGGIISSLNSENSCNTNSEWQTNSLDSITRGEYADLMGTSSCGSFREEINNLPDKCRFCFANSTSPECSKCAELKQKQLKCSVGSQICVTNELIQSIDSQEEDFASGDNCQLCLDPKPNICCTSPNLNPYTTSGEKIKWDEDNKDILNIVGNRVSYICHENKEVNGSPSPYCPNGSFNLKEYEAENCGGNPCDQRNNESSCNNCIACTWVEEDLENGIEAHCSPQCPLPPQVIDGWGVGTQNLTTDPPVITPTAPPTQSPVTSAPTIEPVTQAPTNEPSKAPDSGGSNTSIIIGGVGGVIIIAAAYIFYRSRKKSGKTDLAVIT